MNEKWANKANENLYSYYMEHYLEFREKNIVLQTILVDYANENKLPLHKIAVKPLSLDMGI